MIQLLNRLNNKLDNVIDNDSFGIRLVAMIRTLEIKIALENKTYEVYTSYPIKQQ